MEIVLIPIYFWICWWDLCLMLYTVWIADLLSSWSCLLILCSGQNGGGLT